MRHIIFGFTAGIMLLLTFHYLLHVSGESLQALITFNILFVSMLFPLNGPLKRKMAFLLTGNVVSFLWNNILYLFAFSIVEQFGEIFNTLYIILSPMLNLVWIVSFWSLSLTFISHSKSERVGKSNVD
ncbi:MAG: hypothetical protein QXH37_07695 [Candidatus Bathyarchaeia archaeon]